MAKRTNRLGEKRITRTGHTYEIVEYNTSDDIVVLIDGKRRVKTEYYHFLTQDNLGRTSECKTKNLGLKARQRCGQVAEIIAYNGANDITVRFEDGVVRKKCYLCAFKKGDIAHPDIPSTSPNSLKARSERKSHLGEVRKMNSSGEAKIIEYHSAHDFKVLFLDSGNTVSCRCYHNFKTGEIRDPAISDLAVRKDTVLGKERTLSDGTVAKVINAYTKNGNTYVDVELSNGQFIMGCSAATFRNGKLKSKRKNPPAGQGDSIPAKNKIDFTELGLN